jgi:hypothetical protein
MDYGDAIRLLEQSNQKFEYPVNWGVDLQSEHERYRTEQYAKSPVIVMNYPKAIKAFYMRVNDDGRTVAAIGEIIGGGSDGLGRNMLSQNLPSHHLSRMTKLLEQAIEALRRLPAGSQDDIARTILHLAGSEVEAEPIDSAHLAAVLEGLAQAKRREFGTAYYGDSLLFRLREWRVGGPLVPSRIADSASASPALMGSIVEVRHGAIEPERDDYALFPSVLLIPFPDSS